MHQYLSRVVAIAVLCCTSSAVAAEFRWTGMRNPCKQSAEDGLDSSATRQEDRHVPHPAR